MNLDIMLSKPSQSQNKQILYDSIVYEISKVVKFIEIEGRMVVARVCGEGKLGSCLLGTRFQIY